MCSNRCYRPKYKLHLQGLNVMRSDNRRVSFQNWSLDKCQSYRLNGMRNVDELQLPRQKIKSSEVSSLKHLKGIRIT